MTPDGWATAEALFLPALPPEPGGIGYHPPPLAKTSPHVVRCGCGIEMIYHVAPAPGSTATCSVCAGRAS